MRVDVRAASGFPVGAGATMTTGSGGRFGDALYTVRERRTTPFAPPRETGKEARWGAPESGYLGTLITRPTSSDSVQ